MNTNRFFSIKKLVGAGFFVAAFFAFTASAQAQIDDMKTRFGIKGGVNFSQLYIDQPEVEDENIKIGLHAGVFMKAPISDFFAIQPELYYNNLGAKVSYNGSSLLGIQSGEVRFNLHYVTLPVLASITAGPLSFQAGPYVSYLAAANVKDLKRDGSTGSQADLDKSDFNTLDYGLTGGVAVDIQGFQLGARYNYGFREIGNSDFAGRLTDNSKNSAVQLFVGFGF